MKQDSGAQAKNRVVLQFSGEFAIETAGKGFYEFTDDVANWLTTNQAREGLLTVFVRHTSASLTIQENADHTVKLDLLDALDGLAPQEARYRHDCEGPDDMPAHIRSMVTDVSLSVPVKSARMVLGTWQGLYLVEHRERPHRRIIALHFIGA